VPTSRLTESGRHRVLLIEAGEHDRWREILLHAMIYCGVPAAVEGTRCVREVFAEMGVAE